MLDAASERTARQHWARPGSSHDRVVRTSRAMLPMGIGALAALMIVAPLAVRNEISFVLDKANVEVARERMRVSAATYRGEDGKGQAFELKAGSAVQTSSSDPVVRLRDLSARLQMAEGPATVSADAGRYDMDKEVVSVDGPIVFQSADGYRLETRNVAVGLKTRKVASGGAVEGRMPLGSFSAGRISADLNARTVVLDGRARLRIVQGGAR
jgi:lipopolysaccharide export system protein LptC